jgi:hypothetical protein
MEWHGRNLQSLWLLAGLLIVIIQNPYFDRDRAFDPDVGRNVAVRLMVDLQETK